MTSVNTNLNNLTAGELSPKLYGRSDLAAYFNGARRLENFICQTQGPAIFRNGFQFVAETKDGNKAFLSKFQFSDIQSYMLEFTDKNIRIYKDRGIVLDGGSPIDVVTPYLESELFELKFTQNATDLYIAHPNHQPRKLTRSSDVNWTLTIHAPTGVVPPFNTQAVTNITQADPAVVTYTGDDTFNNGEQIRMDNVVGMTEVNGVTFIVANVSTGANTFELNDSDGNAIDSTGFGAYTSGGDLYNVSNCPAAVAFYEQRLIYGGTAVLPETLWFSKSADPDDFTVGTGATDGLKYTVAAGEDVNKIEWIKGTQDFLVIGGFGDVLVASGGGEEKAIAPDQISIKPSNTFGVADQNPIGKRQSILYMQRNQRTLLSFEADDFGIYSPIDRNVAADHITLSGVTQSAYQEGRPDIVWNTKVNGELIGLTLEKEQQVSGWHRHDTQGSFISIATTPREKDFDTLWTCVTRTVNGSETHHIEFLNDAPEFPSRDDFVTGKTREERKANKVSDGETFQRALLESQKLYIHVDNAGTFDGTQRGVDAGASLTVGAVTGSSISFTADAAVFVAGDVGNEIWVKSTDGTRFGRADIVTFNSTTSVDCDIFLDFDSTDVYPVGEWYITADVITGLDNLEGETVSVVVDGAIHPDRTVTGNQISLDTQASVVHVGLSYIGTIETLDLEGGGQNGPVQTKRKTIRRVGLRLLDTSGLEFGTDYYNLEDRLLRQAVDLMDNPPPLTTGDEVVKFQDNSRQETGGWDREKRVILQQNLALPAQVQMIIPYFSVTND